MYIAVSVWPALSRRTIPAAASSNVTTVAAIRILAMNW
jgi:hypothetical protein